MMNRDRIFSGFNVKACRDHTAHIMFSHGQAALLHRTAAQPVILVVINSDVERTDIRVKVTDGDG
jgi:hypothetical protein